MLTVIGINLRLEICGYILFFRMQWERVFWDNFQCLHRACLIFGPFRHPTGRVRRWVPLSLVTTWEKLLPFWNLAHFVSQSIKSLFVNFFNRHNWITVATRKFFDNIYLSISCQPMLRHIFFTELNGRLCFIIFTASFPSILVHIGVGKWKKSKYGKNV